MNPWMCDSSLASFFWYTIHYSRLVVRIAKLDERIKNGEPEP